MGVLPPVHAVSVIHHQRGTAHDVPSTRVGLTLRISCEAPKSPGFVSCIRLLDGLPRSWDEGYLTADASAAKVGTALSGTSMGTNRVAGNK